MAIPDDPDLNNRINSHQTPGCSIDQKLCKRCGKPMLYSKEDEDGRTDPFFEWRWENRLCLKCFQKHNYDPYTNE